MKENENVSGLSKAIESAELLINTEINKTIRHEGSKWCIYSKSGKKLDCKDTKKEAQERLRQIEHFSKSADGKSDIRKGLPDEILEGGIHLHGLERENSRSKTDGAHQHIFLETRYVQYDEDYPPEKEERILATNEDGIHFHTLELPTSDESLPDGEHSHTVYTYELDESTWDVKEIELETTEDGRHYHQLQVSTSSFDGLHTHTLDMPDGSTLTSLTPGQIWDVLYMRMPQASLIPLPPSSLFAHLSPEQRAILHALYLVDNQDNKAQKNQEDTEDSEDVKEPEPNDFTSGLIQTLKLPNPDFVVKRLLLQKPAGMLSKKNHKVRIGKSQALVNELSPMDFKDSFLWGIVSHGESQTFKRLSDMPQELFDSVDSFQRSEFADEEDVFYLPISLVKAFGEPKKLDTPPKGRRFAGKIDLHKSVVSVLKCSSCETPFEDIGKTKVPFCPRCRATNNTKIAKFMRTEREVRIIKTEEVSKEERYVFGVVLVPDEADAQGDIYDEHEVRKAAHSFMELHSGSLKLMHKGETLDDAAKVLETYVTKQEESHDSETYPIGTWLMASRIIDDGLWSDVKSGEFTGYSIGGSANRAPLA